MCSKAQSSGHAPGRESLMIDEVMCVNADSVLSHSHWQRAAGSKPQLLPTLDTSDVRPCRRKFGDATSHCFVRVTGCTLHSRQRHILKKACVLRCRWWPQTE